MAESAPPMGLAVSQHQTCVICELDFPFLKQLSCRHVLCETCCAGVMRDRVVECPFCREGTAAVDGPSQSLPSLFAGQITCDFCRRLKQTEDSWWCGSCKRVVCSRCEVTDHKHLDHDIEEWNGFGPIHYVATNIHQLESLKESEEEVMEKLHDIFAPIFRKVYLRLKERERSFEGDGVRIKKLYRLQDSDEKNKSSDEFEVTSDLHSFSRLAEEVFELAGHTWSPPAEENRILGISCSTDDIADVIMACLKTSQQEEMRDFPSLETTAKKLTLRDLETSSGVWRYVCGAGDAMLAYNSSEIFLLEINLKDQLVKRARRFEGVAPTDTSFALPFDPSIQHAFSIRLLGGKWSLNALSFLTMTAASSKELANVEPKLKDLKKATYEKAVIAVIDHENIFLGLRLLNETSCWDIFRFQFLNNRFCNPKRMHSIGEDITCLRACSRSKDQVLLAANVDSQKIHVFEFQGNMITSSRAIYPSFGPRLTICGLDIGADLSIVINTQTDTGLIASKNVLFGEEQPGVAPWRRFMVPISSFLGIFNSNSVVLMDRYSWKLQILSLVELK